MYRCTGTMDRGWMLVTKVNAWVKVQVSERVGRLVEPKWGGGEKGRRREGAREGRLIYLGRLRACSCQVTALYLAGRESGSISRGQCFRRGRRRGNVRVQGRRGDVWWWRSMAALTVTPWRQDGHHADKPEASTIRKPASSSTTSWFCEYRGPIWLSVHGGCKTTPEFGVPPLARLVQLS